MGTWGYGNFERDDSYDALGLLLEHIVTEIRNGFTFDSEETLFNDLGDAWIVAHIDILCTLCKHYQTYPELELSELRQWREQYLEVFDRMSNKRGASEYFVQRRKVVSNTFDELEKIVAELHND